MRKSVFGVSDQVDINRAVQPQKTTVEGLTIHVAKNKGAGYREVDLRLCFRICKTPVFS